MSCGRSEPAGLHGLRKQVTRDKRRALGTEEKERKIDMPGGKQGESLGHILENSLGKE